METVETKLSQIGCKKCPACGEENFPASRRCRKCGEEFSRIGTPKPGIGTDSIARPSRKMMDDFSVSFTLDGNMHLTKGRKRLDLSREETMLIKRAIMGLEAL